MSTFIFGVALTAYFPSWVLVAWKCPYRGEGEVLLAALYLTIFITMTATGIRLLL